MSDRIITGSCACGGVTFTARGEPKRAGLCHCMTCRKAHSAAFNPFVVYPAADVEVIGELSSWQSSSSYERRFCPQCGSRVVGGTIGSDEVELSLGSFDQPGEIEPGYESWIIRREPWLTPLPVPQNRQDPA